MLDESFKKDISFKCLNAYGKFQNGDIKLEQTVRLLYYRNNLKITVWQTLHSPNK